MKLQPSQLPDVTDFNYHECTFGGDECIWFFPHLEGVKWTPQNLIFRSSIWRKSDWTLVSPGLKKFFNWSQEPTIYPPPDAIADNIHVVEKLDGSCLIVSKYKGELIIRTRRALATNLLNGDEIELFKKKYPNIFTWRALTPVEDDRSPEQWSLIFEWLTPSNQIVVKYDEPELRLIAAIDHDNYRYTGQWQLDVIARDIGVARPKYFQYKDIGEMLQNIADLKGEEGVCVYYGGGQQIRKIKSDWYLSVHNFRNAMNLKNIVDLYFIMEQPDYAKFCDGVMNQFTWEGLQMARPLISQVCDAMKEVKRILDGMQRFIDERLGGLPRKMVAETIFKAYGETSRADIVFTLYDKKPLNRNQNKKLLFQCLM